VTGVPPGPAQGREAPAGPEAVLDPRRRRRHTFADLYHERTDFRFMDRMWRWAALSGVLVAVSLAALGVRGLNLGIDFEGGVVWQAPVEGAKPDIEDLRAVVEDAGITDAKVSVLDATDASDRPQVRVQSPIVDDPAGAVREAIAETTGAPRAEVVFDDRGSAPTWAAPAPESVDPEAVAAAVDAVEGADAVTAERQGERIVVTVDDLARSPTVAMTSALASFAGVDTSEVSLDTVGPTWGERVTRRAVQAVVIFFVVIAIYLSFRFEWKMAIAALSAVLHDIVVVAGLYALFQFPVSPATVTAFLTILGFSLYDTVVVFDKVRENTETLLASGRATYTEMVNKSLNQVLMRSLSTTLVAVLPVLSLIVVGVWWQGADALADFALALLFGLLVGSYSSIFVATPIMAVWKEREPQYAALRERLASPAAQAIARRRAQRTAARAGAGTTDGAGATDGAVSAPPPQATPERAGGEAPPVVVGPRARQQRRRKRR
jgi:preprotein translocase subunit SecF